MFKELLYCTSVILFLCPRPLTGGARWVQATSPSDRAHWVEITRKLESDPLNEDLGSEGAAVMKEIQNDHTITVTLCPPLLFDFNGMKYAYSRAITRQFMLAAAAFIVGNPEKADNSRREYRREKDLAALESMLRAYASILKAKPDATQKFLDGLLRQQREGKLADYVQKRCP